MKKIFIFFLFSPFYIFGLDLQPWLGNIYEFYFETEFCYYRYTKVNNATVQLSSPSNNYLLSFDLGLTTTPYWEFAMSVEFDKSPDKKFGFGSFAFQARKLWLDDIIGDFVSLNTFFDVRYTGHKTITDVSTFYGGDLDFKGNISIGKEFDYKEFWRYRIWACGSIGIANIGSPWLMGHFAIETNYQDKHKGSIFCSLRRGYGSQKKIDIDHFHGYARIREKHVDVGINYGLGLDTWGTLQAQYVRRVYAKRCPENVNFFYIAYNIPFSF